MTLPNMHPDLEIYHGTNKAIYFRDIRDGAILTSYKGKPPFADGVGKQAAAFSNDDLGRKSLKALKANKELFKLLRVVYRCPRVGHYPRNCGQVPRNNALVISVIRK